MDPALPSHVVPIALEIRAERHATDRNNVVNDQEAGKGIELDYSYDVDSEGISEDDIYDSEELDEEDLRDAIVEAKNAFPEEEVGNMLQYLKEKGMVEWMKEYVAKREISVKKLLMAFGVLLPKDVRETVSDLSPSLMNVLKVTLTRILRKRERISKYNTVEDVLTLLRSSSRIIVLSGAGISVSCGIPDFRSSTGLYAMLSHEGKYQLDDPQQMFDIGYFKENPEVFYSFASQIYPSNFVPSSCHRFIKTLEERDKLLRNYTQNIDTLETIMGIQRVLQCHGSFATASCIQCKTQVDGSEIKEAIFAKEIPLCKACEAAKPPKKPAAKKAKKKNKARPWEDDGSDEDAPGEVTARPKAIMKPGKNFLLLPKPEADTTQSDITFFGEPLTDRFHSLLFEDRQATDLLVVIGTSLKVAPVAEILTHLPHSIPQILINKTPVPHVNPDVVLLGDADGIVKYLCKRLDWDLAALPEAVSKTPQHNSKKRELDQGEPQQIGKSHVWLFDGAEGGRWVDQILAISGDESMKTNDSSATNTPPTSHSSRPSTSRTSSTGLGKGDSDGSRETKKARKK